MATDHRMNGPSGPVPFTCENRRFRTDVSKGQPHGKSPAKGAVTGKPLVDVGGYSLWLEHVETTDDDGPTGDYYWLMWYDPSGLPTIPMSGVFGPDDLARMVEQLMAFVPR